MSQKIDLPDGGWAVLADTKAEMSPRKRRPMELVAARLGRVMEDLVVARRILVDGDVVDDRSEKRDKDGELRFQGPDINLTERQYELLSRLNDATVFGLLLDWSLGPLPERPDDLLDSDPAVYDTLRLEAAKISIAINSSSGFNVDSVEDLASPTGP